VAKWWQKAIVALWQLISGWRQLKLSAGAVAQRSRHGERTATKGSSGHGKSAWLVAKSAAKDAGETKEGKVAASTAGGQHRGGQAGSGGMAWCSAGESGWRISKAMARKLGQIESGGSERRNNT
jgi:hypothetical protein